MCIRDRGYSLCSGSVVLNKSDFPAWCSGLEIDKSVILMLFPYLVGQFGKVYKAILVRPRSENMTVAVKTIKRYKSEQETSDFLHEMGVMMDLMHPNIIHLYGIVEQGLSA